MTKNSDGVLVLANDENGLVAVGIATTANPTGAGYRPGCFLIGCDGKNYNNGGDGTTAAFQNIDSISTGEIADGAVTLAKMANVATASVFYRKTAATGVPEVQSLATLKTDLGLTGTNSGDQTIALTGDVTGSGVGTFAATLRAGIPTVLAALQNEVTTTGAISIANFLTTIDTTAAPTAYTLAAGTYTGQLKKIMLRVDGGDATVTGVFDGTNNTLTFANAGEYALLEWDGAHWIAVELTSVLSMTQAPVLSTV